jgi:hypothetical protein
MTMTPGGADPVGGLRKVVRQIECRFIATDGDAVAAVYEAVTLGDPAPASFKPFADCTADDFLAWVKGAKGAGYETWKAAMEAAAIAGLTAPKPFSGAPVSAPAG